MSLAWIPARPPDWSLASTQPHLFPTWQPEGVTSATTCQSLSLTLQLRASRGLLSSCRVKAQGPECPDPSIFVFHLHHVPLSRRPRPSLWPQNKSGLLCLRAPHAPHAATLLPQPCRASSFTTLALSSEATSQGPFLTTRVKWQPSCPGHSPDLFSLALTTICHVKYLCVYSVTPSASSFAKAGTTFFYL